MKNNKIRELVELSDAVAECMGAVLDPEGGDLPGALCTVILAAAALAAAASRLHRQACWDCVVEAAQFVLEPLLPFPWEV